MFFGGGGGGGGGFGGAAGGGPRKSKPIMHKLAASLEDLYLGKKKKLAINREVACSGCDGKGGSKVETCSSCKGRGMKVITKQIGPGMIQVILFEIDCAIFYTNCFVNSCVEQTG